MPDKEEKIIDLPSDGPDTEVTLPEETVKEGAQDVAVPEKKFLFPNDTGKRRAEKVLSSRPRPTMSF